MTTGLHTIFQQCHHQPPAASTSSDHCISLSPSVSLSLTNTSTPFLLWTHTYTRTHVTWENSAAHYSTEQLTANTEWFSQHVVSVVGDVAAIQHSPTPVLPADNTYSTASITVYGPIIICTYSPFLSAHCRPCASSAAAHTLVDLSCELLEFSAEAIFLYSILLKTASTGTECHVQQRRLLPYLFL